MGEKAIITLTTDFGLGDGYVAAMKGVILGIIPDARLIDVSHAVAPYDVRQAAYVIYSVYRWFPPASVHLAVVDPGVGSARRAIAVETPRGRFVGPDNGLFSYVLLSEPSATVVQILAPDLCLGSLSPTFHGRDLFAAATARLAAGESAVDLGPAIGDPVVLTPHALASPEGIEGVVMHVDHFGNLITSIASFRWNGDALWLFPASWIASAEGPVTGVPSARLHQPSQGLQLTAARAVVGVGGRTVTGVRRTYADARRGELLALIGSSGHLELAVRDGSAARILRLGRGAPVLLRWGAEQS